MEGPLLRVFFFLMASRGGSGQLLGDLCYRPMKAPGTHMVAYYCPGFSDPADARFCCGTCSQPFCCSSQKNSLNPTQCPPFDTVPEVTGSTPPALREDGRLNVLWCFIGIVIGTLVVWGVCRSLPRVRLPRFCFNDEEEEEEEEVVEMEERRSPVPPPHVLPPPPSPPPPRFTDYPPPYSAIDNFPSVPVSVTNAPLEMGPTEGATPAQLRGAEGGARSRIRGAEWGAPARFREAEGGAPARFREAEWGDPPPPYPDDPPPYSAIDPFAPPSLPPPVPRPSRRKRRAKASGAVGGAPAEPAGAMGGAPAEPAGVVGGAPAEPAGAVGGAPAEASGAEGRVPAEPSGAEGGAFAM